MQNAPVLQLGLALYLNAFFDLDTERDRVDLQPIARSKAFAYACDYEFDDEQKEDLWFYVQRMDLAALKWQHDDNKRRTPKPPSGG